MSVQNPVLVSQLQDGDIILHFKHDRSDLEGCIVGTVTHDDWNRYCVHYGTNSGGKSDVFYAFGYEYIAIRRDE
jgi:hypothetical protein